MCSRILSEALGRFSGVFLAPLQHRNGAQFIYNDKTKSKTKKYRTKETSTTASQAKEVIELLSNGIDAGERGDDGHSSIYTLWRLLTTFPFPSNGCLRIVYGASLCVRTKQFFIVSHKPNGEATALADDEAVAR